MHIRIFDCWVHEQDMRRATGRPGHLTGPVVHTTSDADSTSQHGCRNLHLSGMRTLASRRRPCRA
jgi:hypothetical protein